KKTDIRSTTLFGLSVINVMFEDKVDDFFARQQVYLMARNTVLLPLPQKYVRTNASFHPKEIAVSSEGKLRSS
ncbi:hypothetical protein, partial [Parabacteroides distasonis]|uniref:hypothetical protein n=1 Tax=Parabacteroides distasonis TaxID=823 RepID=UPI00210E9024